MAVTYIKKASKNATTLEDDTREIVSKMLKEIEAGGEERCIQYLSLIHISEPTRLQ